MSIGVVRLLRLTIGIVKDGTGIIPPSTPRIDTFVRIALRTAIVIAGIVVLGSLVALTWRWVDPRWSQGALAAHLEGRKAYAARVLEVVGVLPDELRESSGLAISRTQPGILWSHNDSGDGPNLYAVDMSGKLLAQFRMANALARDWEDIAAGPCPDEMAKTAPPKSECLYVADTGDNDQVRPEVTIYIVVEPRVGDAGAQARPVPARSFHYRYPDKPTDAEALAVLPNRDLTIVSKGRNGTVDFFSIPAATVARAITSSETVTAQYAGDTGIKPESKTGQLVTGAAISPDGKTLAVRTYYEVYFFGLVNDSGQIRWRDLQRPCSLGDAEPQGEAIDYLDANTLLLTSERARGRPGEIHRLQCQ
jgi:hypothetical protein